MKNRLRPSHRSWDERYREKPTGSEPGDLLVGFSALLPSGGRALDLACGGGRNALYLAQCGLRVLAVDRSGEALEQGRELAHQRNLPVDWVQANLENFAIPEAAFDVVVCFYFGPGELLKAFGDWDVIFFRETWIERGVAALVARKPQAYCGSDVRGRNPM